VAQTAAATTLSMAGASTPENWGNPFASTSITRLPLQSAVLDPLVRVTSAGVLEPWLAESWSQATPTTWRITLRKNVRFSNGEPFDADAVVDAVRYLQSEAGQREAIGRELIDLASVSAREQTIVELTTKTPDPLLPYRLSLLAIPAPKAWAAMGRDAFTRAPVGTGPFVLKEIAPNATTLGRNPTSWRKTNIDAVSLLTLQEPAARRAALSTGRIDVALTSVTPNDFDELTAEGSRAVIDRVPAVVAMAFVSEKFAPFRDARVRRALTHAVNRQAIVDAIMGGRTKVAAQPAGHGWFGFNDDLKPLAYDPALARKLLAEAGYADGFAFDMEVPTGAVAYPDVFQTVAQDLAKVGVRMTVLSMPQQKVFENIQTGGWKGHAAAIPFSSPIFDALYPQRQHSCLWHTPWFCDPAMSRDIDAAQAATTPDQRREKTRAVMAKAHDLAQALFLYETVAFSAVGPRVIEFPMDFSFILYEGVRLTK
jgi:peptide/nickel transport system substrate-binding protein